MGWGGLGQAVRGACSRMSRAVASSWGGHVHARAELCTADAAGSALAPCRPLPRRSRMLIPCSLLPGDPRGTTRRQAGAGRAATHLSSCALLPPPRQVAPPTCATRPSHTSFPTRSRHSSEPAPRWWPRRRPQRTQRPGRRHLHRQHRHRPHLSSLRGQGAWVAETCQGAGQRRCRTQRRGRMHPEAPTRR